MWLIVVAVISWFTLLAWIAAAILTLRARKGQRPLVVLDEIDLKQSDAPSVSILVPCRNEAGRVLRQSIGSMLAQDYGKFELIAIDDRSTDETKAILFELAARDPRMRVIEGAEVPEGWIGKPHALQQGLQAARGEWILATDADMLYAPEALREAIAHARCGSFDALSFIPRVDCLSFWERVFMPVFGWILMVMLPLYRVNDPRHGEAIAAGGFFLIKREILERLGGYSVVRNEVAEDLRLAEKLKRAGARFRLEYAPHLVRTRMQTNLREIWEGFSKNLFAGVGYRPVQGTAGAFLTFLLGIAPPLITLTALLKGDLPAAIWVPAAFSWAVQVAIFMAVDLWADVPILYALTAPLGFALFGAILLNSTIRIATGIGVTWRGRRLYAEEIPPRY
ncbi:MAG: glycosyltransferase [Pyrinomonas methylaliphatogenes]|nr:glycosyltransferase [Pyrinomonas methylaliphatogenes]